MLSDPKFTYEVVDLHGRASKHYAEASGVIKNLDEIKKLLVHKFGEECKISNFVAVTGRNGHALSPQPAEFSQ